MLRREGLHAGGAESSGRGLHAGVSEPFQSPTGACALLANVGLPRSRQICVPPRFLETQRASQRLPSGDTERSHRPRRPLPVSAVSSAIRLPPRFCSLAASSCVRRTDHHSPIHYLSFTRNWRRPAAAAPLLCRPLLSTWDDVPHPVQVSRGDMGRAQRPGNRDGVQAVPTGLVLLGWVRISVGPMQLWTLLSRR